MTHSDSNRGKGLEVREVMAPSRSMRKPMIPSMGPVPVSDSERVRGVH